MPLFRSALVATCLTVAALAAHADLLDDVMKAKKIRISTDFAIPPAGMMDANMQPSGSDVETAKLLAQDWGVQIEWVPTTGATRIPNVNTGKADIIISTLSVTPERAKVIDFSKPYAVLQSVVGAPKSAAIKDWADLKGKSVTVTRGTTQDTELSAMANDNGHRRRHRPGRDGRHLRRAGERDFQQEPAEALGAEVRDPQLRPGDRHQAGRAAPAGQAERVGCRQPEERQAQCHLQEVLPRRPPGGDDQLNTRKSEASMKLVIGSDHAGWALKGGVIAHIKALGHEVIDVGSHDPNPVDFPDIARALTAKVLSGEAQRGIMVCGTGVGASIAANKVRGIRAAVCHDVHSAHQSVEHDDVNVMCIGAQIVGPWLANDLVASFLAAQFEDNEDYRRRVAKLHEMDGAFK
jgi:ribose 5-phosphate isomerase B